MMQIELTYVIFWYSAVLHLVEIDTCRLDKHTNGSIKFFYDYSTKLTFSWRAILLYSLRISIIFTARLSGERVP